MPGNEKRPSIDTPTAMGIMVDALGCIRDINPEMPMQTAIIFLLVAKLNDRYSRGIPMKELREMVGLSQASMSRNTTVLGTSRDDESSRRYGLILVREDPNNRRRKLVRLSAKGRRVANEISSVFDGLESDTLQST